MRVAMQVGLLGRPAIAGDGAPTELKGPRQAGLLALLAVDVGRVVRTSRIEDELWDGQRMSESAVRVNVNRLRARFLALTGADPVVSHTLGYSLELDPAAVDTNRFEAAAGAVLDARATGQLDEAVQRADDAERLWRGPAFEGVADLPSVQPERERLDALRVEVWQERAIALILLGAHDPALAQLDHLLAAAPYRERAWALRLLALARAGRRDEVATRFRQAVELLDRDLAMAPGPELVAIAEAARTGGPEPELARRLLEPPGRPGTVADPAGAGPTDRAGADDGGGAGDPGAGRDTVPAGVITELGAGAAAWPPPADGTAFVGRADLLDELVAAVLDEEDRSPLIVEGPPGIGKTRLAAEVARRVVDAGGVVIGGTCPRTGGSSLAPVADLVRGALAAGDRSGAGGPGLTGLDALAALVPAAFPDRVPRPDLDPDIRRLQLFDAATQAVAGIATAPVLVVVDDVHWVADDAARFLAHLVERADARWLLLARAAERTPAAVDLLADLARRSPRWRTLGPLAADEVSALVDQQAGATEGWTDAVCRRSGGNPFLATELVRHLGGGGDPDDVPPGVEQLAAAARGRLTDDARRVADVLTLAREPVPHAALAEAAELDPDRCDRAVAELEVAGLAVDARSGVRVAHDLVADALDAAIRPGRRRRVHTAIGRALATRAPDRRPAALAHLLEGDPGHDGAELDAVAAAALHQLNGGAAFHEAVRLGGRYLDASGPDARTREGLDARIQYASALLIAGPFGRGRVLLDRISPEVRRQGDAVLSADIILAQGSMNVADPQLSVRVDETRLVLDALDPSQRTRRIQLACLAAHHLALLGRTGEAAELLARAEEDDRSEPDPVLEAMILAMRLQVASGSPTPPAAVRAAFADLAAHADAHPSASTEAWVALFALDQAVRDGTLDDHEAAIDALEQLAQRFPRGDLRWAVSAARAGNALTRGDLDRGEQLILAAQETGGELSVGSAASVWLIQLFMLQYERGAMAVMTPFLSSLTENSSPYQLAARALLHLEAGDLVRAREMAARLADTDRVLAAGGVGWSTLASQVGDIAFATGDRRLAAAALDELAPHAGTALSALGFLHVGAADRSIGTALAALGDLDSAIDALERAHADDRRRGAPRWAGRAARSAAVVRRQRRRRGDLAAARALDQEAARLLGPAADAGPAPV